MNVFWHAMIALGQLFIALLQIRLVITGSRSMVVARNYERATSAAAAAARQHATDARRNADRAVEAALGAATSLVETAEKLVDRVRAHDGHANESWTIRPDQHLPGAGG